MLVAKEDPYFIRILRPRTMNQTQRHGCTEFAYPWGGAWGRRIPSRVYSSYFTSTLYHSSTKIRPRINNPNPKVLQLIQKYSAKSIAPDRPFPMWTVRMV